MASLGLFTFSISFDIFLFWYILFLSFYLSFNLSFIQPKSFNYSFIILVECLPMCVTVSFCLSIHLFIVQRWCISFSVDINSCFVTIFRKLTFLLSLSLNANKGSFTQAISTRRFRLATRFQTEITLRSS